MTYEYEVVAKKSAGDRRTTPIIERTALTSKRAATRTARRETREAWAANQHHYFEVRANVYAVGNGKPSLIRQVYISTETAKNGWRRMLRDEEV